MPELIGGEYIVALGLIKESANGNNSIFCAELRSLASSVQNRLDELKINAVVDDYNLRYIASEYVKYFDFGMIHNIPYVKGKIGIGMQDLQHRFIDRLPTTIRDVMMDFIKE